MTKTEYSPQPNQNGTRFYLHLANWAEFLSWFSCGVALSFIAQLQPKMMLLYPIGFVFVIGYFISSFSINPTANLLRIMAVIFSLVGFWNLIYLYRDLVLTSMAAILVFAAIAGVFLWRIR